MQSKIIQVLTLIILATSAIAAAAHTSRTTVPCFNQSKTLQVQTKKDVTAASLKISPASVTDFIFSEAIHADKAFN